MSHSPQTRYSLVARLANSGDAGAWEEFLSLYQPLILRMAARYGLQESDARDVCQEVYSAVAKDVERFEPDDKPASFRRWLFSIARFRICRLLEKQRRLRLATGGSDLHVQLNLVVDPQGSDDHDIESEYRRQLLVELGRKIRNEFRETTWLAFWKTAVEGQAGDVVAGELALEVGAVYAAKCRVMKRLRDEVRRMEGETD